MDRTLKQRLDEIFAPNRSGLGGTGLILVSPSSIDASIAKAIVAEADLDGLAEAAGVIAARIVADALEQRALRPADYADLQDVTQLVMDRLVKLLPKSAAFSKAFNDSLRMRG